MISHRKHHRRALCWLLLVCSLPAWSQPPADDKPAVDTGAAERPAVEMPSRSAAPAGSGTNIIGDRESPIGLYITPWRNAAAEADIDRPARLLSLELEPIDKRVFARQVEYYDALTAAARAKTAVSAPPPPAP